MKTPTPLPGVGLLNPVQLMKLEISTMPNRRKSHFRGSSTSFQIFKITAHRKKLDRSSTLATQKRNNEWDSWRVKQSTPSN